MAASVDEDRFRREIQLAARLQHPHIVPLLAAGSARDLLYYTMPFIKGESLRSKLGREGELPVGEAVRILREVTDALAYAHAEGVVHRDIKPDNVMISGGHALVTDFGVAKAVSDSTAGHTVTSMGLAIGTPAYMAPEQASGDPHVDHRADLYALGAMAFEMLAGRPPFTGGNTQSLLAAHVTQTPEPVGQLRPAIPPALSGVVMRCLEKRAADRWQQAHELLPHFDQLLTPSGAGTPATAAMYVSSGTEAAIRRSHPGRVLATFAMTAIGLLGLVWFLVQQLGLPWWVLAATGALVAVGLPVVLVTARHERQRALSRATSASHATASGAAPGFTWRKARTAGAVAFAGLGVLTVAYMAMRLLGIGAVGTLLARGALSERDRIVLAEFDSRTPDSTLGATVTELLRTDLSQSRTVSVYDVAQVSEVVRQMQRPPGSRVTFDVAREVATRQGLKAVLAGDIASLGNSYILSARLVATNGGEVLWAGRENATADDLATAVDRLSATLREKVGESLRSIRADPPLQEMTTSSTEALRLSAQADRRADAGDNAGAIALLERAIALDSNFAMAYRRVSVLMRNSGGDTAKIRAAAQRAFALRDRLSVRERYMVDANYHNAVTKDTAKTIAAYDALLDLYPDDRAATNNLGIIYRAQGKRNEARELYWRAITNGTAASVTFSNAIPLEVELRGLDSAGVMVDAFARAYPDNPNVPLLRAHYLAAVGQIDSARAILEARREATRGNARLQATVLYRLLELAVSRGRLDEALAFLREARRTELTAVPPDGRGLPAAEELERTLLEGRANIALEFLRDTVAALRLIEQSVRQYPPERRATPNAFLDATRAFAAAGSPDRARTYWRRWEAAEKDSLRNDPFPYALYVRAALATADGRYADAIRDLHLARERVRACAGCYLGQIAIVFEAAGQPDSAIAYLERNFAVPVLGPRAGVEWRERLARLYEKRGDRANAARTYSDVAELWKDADPVLQPRVKAAREKAAAR